MKTHLQKLATTILIFLNIFMVLSACQSSSSAVSTPTLKEESRITQTTEVDIPSTATAESLSPIDEILHQLQGLPINQFFEESYFQLSLRYPEDLAELGIEDYFGITDPKLNDISQEFQSQTMQLERGILDLLKKYNRSSLTPEDQISYDVYLWYLEDIVAGQEYLNFQYIASYFILNSIHNQTFSFFIQNHPINNLEQAQDYVARLWLLEGKFSQLVEGLRIREKMGILQPKFSLQWALYDLKTHTNSVAHLSPYYTRFEEKLNSLTLSPEERQNLLSEAEQAIENSVNPAYDALKSELTHQESVAPEAVGLWQYQKGEEYYAYLLQHYTTTDLTSDEIHQLGFRELERIHGQMQIEFDKLGYAQEESLLTKYQRLAEDGGIIPSNQAVEFYESLISKAYQDLEPAFDMVPQAKVIVVGGPTGGYYVQGSLDGSRPGAFYAAIQGRGEPYFRMPSLTYHESVPGHHFQIGLAIEMDLPTFRNHVSFPAYVEGWALYAERLAFDLGWYEDDPYANLGRLQYEALRAARLVVDTGIHAKQWSFSQAVDFLVENVGWQKGECEAQIARYAILPGQATAYMVGMLKILELRQAAQNKLGDQFDLKEFHNQILSSGSMPLSILEKEFLNELSNQN